MNPLLRIDPSAPCPETDGAPPARHTRQCDCKPRCAARLPALGVDPDRPADPR